MVTADEIRSRTFIVSLRGFDREEVKAFLSEVAVALESAQERVRELEAEAVEAGGGPVTGADAAGEAASPDLAPAEREGGTPAGGQAGEQVSPFAELGAETQRILEAAQEAGAQIRKRAQADAERELKAARAQAARIIAEGERQREEVGRAVEALTGARTELADDLREVGRTIERILRELGPARAAGTVREAIAEAAREEAARDEPPAADGPPRDLPAGDEVPPGGEPVQPRAAEAGVEPRPGDAAQEEEAPEAVEEPLAAPEEPDEAGEPGEAEEEGAGEEPDDDSRSAPVTVGAPARGQAGGPGANAAGPLPAGTVLDPGVLEPGGPAVNGERGEPPGGTRQRTRVLAPLHSRLVRKLKRGLQDLQNATLDALRRDPDRTDVEPFLPDTSAVRALAALAEEQLERAHAAGIAAGAEDAGADTSLEPSGRALADQLGSELGGVLVTRLADTLRTGFDARQGMAALTERVDSVFARIKSGPAGDVASVALVRAYEGGRKDAWAASGVTHRRWMRATEPPCTDPRCVDNESAGAVPVGERFPSRHDAPPVRPGCQCSTAPAGS